MIITPGLTSIQGFLKIYDPKSGEVFVDKKNAIHYENISICMANTLADRNTGFGHGLPPVDNLLNDTNYR